MLIPTAITTHHDRGLIRLDAHIHVNVHEVIGRPKVERMASGRCLPTSRIFKPSSDSFYPIRFGLAPSVFYFNILICLVNGVS